MFQWVLFVNTWFTVLKQITAEVGTFLISWRTGRDRKERGNGRKEKERERLEPRVRHNFQRPIQSVLFLSAKFSFPAFLQPLNTVPQAEDGPGIQA